jgi:hypothetical protein
MDMNSRVSVQCYSGHDYATEPRVIVGPKGRQEVTDILRRWREPEGPAFRVRLEDGSTATLFYNETSGNWTMREDLPQDNSI